MKQLYLIMTASAFLTAASGRAQDNPLLDAYRAQVEAYSPDLRTAEYAASASGEARQSARADFFPKLSGGANFNYTGHPLRKDIALPGTDDVYTFEGRNTKYGASVSLAQPLYAGGALRAGYDKAQAEDEMARQEIRRVTNDLRHEADVRYWSHVAQCELVSVADGYRQSVGRLVEVVRQRVEAEYTDRNDLLMAEVRLNDADYQVQRARNDAEVARLSLNALAGIPSDQHIATDTLVVPLTVVQPLTDEVDDLLMRRPEMGMAEGNVRVQQSAARLANARYLPTLSIGVDGSYSSPGYDFRADLDPNYAIYAKLSVPIFEWGKRRRTKNMGRYQVDIARERCTQVGDGLRLEVETAQCNYAQAVEQVRLTESSLRKAAESAFPSGSPPEPYPFEAECLRGKKCLAEGLRRMINSVSLWKYSVKHCFVVFKTSFCGGESTALSMTSHRLASNKGKEFRNIADFYCYATEQPTIPLGHPALLGAGMFLLFLPGALC